MLKLWKVRVQLVDPQNDSAYREDEYEFHNSHEASEAAFDACEVLFENENVVSVNGEVKEVE